MLGRKRTGAAFLAAGIATMAIGASLAVMDLGQLYQSVAADPLGSTDDSTDDPQATSRAILWRVGVAASGVPLAVVGSVMLRRRARRGS